MDFLINMLGGVPAKLHRQIVKDCKDEANEHFEEANKYKVLYEAESRKCDELNKVIRKIEGDVIPEDLRAIDELRLKLKVCNKPYLEVVTAALPVHMNVNNLPTDEMSMRRTVIEADARIGVGYILEDGEPIQSASHRLAVNLARECGEMVTQKLLEHGGWRPKIRDMRK